MYKDPNKQREANKQAQARFKASRVLPKDVQGIINRLSDSDEERARRTSIAIGYQKTRPDLLSNEQVIHTDEEFTKLMAQAKPGHISVSKPGDAGYRPTCETTRDWSVNR